MMTPKTCGGASRNHYYYQCTRENHSHKTQCAMPYAPAPKLEEAVIERIKEIALDEAMIDAVIKEANGQAGDAVSGLRQERLEWEGKVKAARDRVANLLNQIEAGNGGPKIKERLREREEECQQAEQQLADVQAEIDRITKQNLGMQTVCQSLRRFRQIADGATPEELKRIVPLFVESVTWHRNRVDLALFENQVRQGEDISHFANHLGGGAQSCSKWLRRNRRCRGSVGS